MTDAAVKTAMSRLGLDNFIQAGGKSTYEQGFKSVGCQTRRIKIGGLNLPVPFG